MMSAPPVKTQGYRVAKDGALLVHPDFGVDTAVAADDIQIPQTDTAAGAGFGDVIADSDRAFAAGREPVAHFLTYGMAADMTEKWFEVNDPDTAEADPALDRLVQDALAPLEFQRRLTEAIESERIYGASLLVGGFNDAKSVDALRTELRTGSELLQLVVYPSTKDDRKIREWTVEAKDEDENSPRYGEPVLYKLDRGGGRYLIVHYTRVCPVETRSNATSVLDPIWDDLTCGRNIRWGASQWMYRTGGGFPVVSFPAGTSAAQLEAYNSSGAFQNLMSRSAIFVAQNSKQENNGVTFTFEGAASHALDPSPFFRTNLEQIAVATGIPQARLIGAQAGAVTGSEVNLQDYYKVISREQAKLDGVVRWVIDHLSASGQITRIKVAADVADTDKYHVALLKRMLRRVIQRDYRPRTTKQYTIEWRSAFELSEQDEAQTDLTKAQTRQAQLDYMTIDEVRALDQLDPLPNGEGATLKRAVNPFGSPGEGEEDFSVRRHRKPTSAEAPAA